MALDLGSAPPEQQFVDAFEAFVREQALFVENVHHSLLELTKTESPNRARVRTPNAQPARVPLARTSVLVVESSELYRVLFGRVFGSEPLELVFAKNEDEASHLQSGKSFEKVIRRWGERLRNLPSQTDRQTVIQEVRAELGLSAEI